MNLDLEESISFKVDLRNIGDEVDLIDSEIWNAATEYQLFDIWAERISGSAIDTYNGALTPTGCSYVIITPLKEKL